jgi:hypothetical protein
MIISHRINTVAALESTPLKYGVEVDIQMVNGRLVTGHDPGLVEEEFDDWLSTFDHALLAANIKQEGIEQAVISACEDRGVRDFFLFDLSFPKLFQVQNRGESRIAVRVSDMEGFSNLHKFVDKVDWVWLDAFEDYAFIHDALPVLKKFRVCLVSPELHVSRELSINLRLKSQLMNLGVQFEAICTKEPSLWEIQP